MFPDFSLPALVVPLAFAALGAGLVRGFTGFGGALTFVPFAAALVGPQQAVVLFWSLDIMLQVPFLQAAWRKADRAAIFPLVLGAALGGPIGVQILKAADPVVMRWVIGCLTLLALAVLVSGFRLAKPPTTRGSFVVGVFSGICSGMASLGGVAVAVFWLAGRGANDAIRAGLLIYLAFITMFGGVNLYFAGLLSLDAMKTALPLLPVYAAALWIGSLGFRRYGGLAYRPVAYALVGLGALLSLPALDGLMRG